MQTARIIYTLDRLWRGLYAIRRAKDSDRVIGLRRTMPQDNNKPALRAWALKARRVIGEIES
jgi:hypothetical protein